MNPSDGWNRTARIDLEPELWRESNRRRKQQQADEQGWREEEYLVVDVGWGSEWEEVTREKSPDFGFVLYVFLFSLASTCSTLGVLLCCPTRRCFGFVTGERMGRAYNGDFLVLTIMMGIL